MSDQTNENEAQEKPNTDDGGSPANDDQRDGADSAGGIDETDAGGYGGPGPEVEAADTDEGNGKS